MTYSTNASELGVIGRIDRTITKISLVTKGVIATYGARTLSSQVLPPTQLTLDIQGNIVASTTSVYAPRTIDDLHWTKEQAMQIRGLFSAFSDWDDPSMDIYDEYYGD